jgi:hypothetical protein
VALGRSSLDFVLANSCSLFFKDFAQQQTLKLPFTIHTYNIVRLQYRTDIRTVQCVVHKRKSGTGIYPVIHRNRDLEG